MTTAVTVDAVISAVPAALIVGRSGERPAAVVDLTHDSRQVGPGWAFACVTGERSDGHDFAAAAVEAGAVMLLVERTLPLDVPQLVVTDVRRAMGPAAAAVHGHPAERLTMVGITGTNGKTTTTAMLGSILRATGRDVRMQGTLSGARTTPEAPDLQRQLAEYVDEGVDAVVMEVSSHAMVFHRVAGTHFDVVVFTNLGRDHLDLHESMEAYFRAKASLFDPALAATGVTNLDDPSGRLIFDAAQIEMRGYSLADAVDVAVTVDRHSFTWQGHSVTVPVGGHFNVMNSIAALTTADVVGVSPDDAVRGLATCTTVPGRFETVDDPTRDQISVVVDYAHTPDGLEALLGSARQMLQGGRLVAVFGCAGDRDAEKRAPMGAVGAALADLAIITSDNPRREDPASIIADVLAGVASSDRAATLTEVDRRTAISLAIGRAQPGDIVVIAGKGHETTQTIGDDVRPFDDRVVAREFLAELAAGSVDPAPSPLTGGPS
ncbi:MAG: UDP-N-acetylmuramoyl-L-alanyl-D-glutamate--2,6-diaminopimelate ligase [Ilumatobacteraceae bacterium]